jgi:hypothetical protein
MTTERPQQNIPAFRERLHPVFDDVGVDSNHARHAVPPELPANSPEHYPVSTTARPPLNGRYQSPIAHDDQKPTSSPSNDGTGATAANLPHTERESIANNVLMAERNHPVTSQKHDAVSFVSELANTESETETPRLPPVNFALSCMSGVAGASPRNRPEVATDFICEACLGTGLSAHFLGRCRHCAGSTP